MELELKKKKLNYCEKILDTTIPHEETMEMIVPDACPDILRIIDTEGKICIRSKNSQEGRAEIIGTVKASVLYIPDGERGIRRLDMAIPFSCMVDNREITQNTNIIVRPCLQAIETRLINPRKVLTRANIMLTVCGYNPVEIELCTDVKGTEDGSVELLREAQSAYFVVCAKEKDFTFVDELSISNTKPGADEILRTHINLSSSDAKMIGNKLVFKGIALVEILYRSLSAELCTVKYELPFSQIMEIEDAGEDADCAIEMVLTGADFVIGGESAPNDNKIITISLYLKSQAVISANRQMDLISDLYSTAFDLTTELQPYTFHSLMDKTTKRQTMRETIETGTLTKSVMDAYVHMGAANQTRDGGKVTVSAEAYVVTIYTGEDNDIYEASRTITVSCQVEVPENCVCSAYALCPGEVFASPSTSGIEIRFPVDFEIMVTSSQKIIGVSGIRVDTTTPKDLSNKPSVVLRMMSGQERLWDIAKKYNTTVKEIMTANELTENNAILESRLLLIPKKR